MRYPPSTGVASYGEPGGPRRRSRPGLPKISWAIFGKEVRARRRAAVALTHHPSGGSIRAGKRLGHLGEDRGFQLHPSNGFRLQHRKEPAIDQGFDDGLDEFPDFVVFVRGRGDQGQEIARFLYLRMDGGHRVSPAPRQARPDRLPTGRAPWSSDGHVAKSGLPQTARWNWLTRCKSRPDHLDRCKHSADAIGESGFPECYTPRRNLRVKK